MPPAPSDVRPVAPLGRRWPPDHMSASSFALLLDCSRRYAGEYRDRLSAPRTGPLVLGSAVDRAVELALHQRWAAHGDGRPGAVDGAYLEATFREAFATQADAGAVTDWGREGADGLLEDGLAVVRAPAVLDALADLHLASGRAAGGPEAGPALQHRVELRVPGVPVPVVGFVDAVARSDDGRTLTVVDLKVSRRRWPAQKAHGEFQWRIYTAALRQRGLPLAALRFRYLVVVRSPLPAGVVVQALDVDLSEDALYATLDTLREAWRQLEAGAFPANPSSWRCTPACPVWRDGQCLGAGRPREGVL